MQLPRSEEVYELALEGLSRVNEFLYKRDPALPSVYAGGVKYKREPREVWRHAEAVTREGWGDCEDLAAARVGELRAKGEAGARVRVVRTGPRMTHAIVERASGKREDPSARLGMYNDNEQSGDEEEIGADPSTTAELTWSVHRTPDGWRGVVRVPLDAGRCLTVKRTAKSEKGAAESALASASKVLDSPAARALIPPQARLALAIARSPKLRSVAKSVLKLF